MKFDRTELQFSMLLIDMKLPLELKNGLKSEK
jgi:hypothetical protein